MPIISKQNLGTKTRQETTKTNRDKIKAFTIPDNKDSIAMNGKMIIPETNPIGMTNRALKIEAHKILRLNITDKMKITIKTMGR